MTRLRGLFTRVRKDENGATMVEYSILIGLITALVITLIVAVGGFVSGAWTALCDALDTGQTTVAVTCP